MHLARVETVAANLAHAVLLPPETGRLAVRLGNRASGMSRYENPALGSKPFRALIYLLESAGFLALDYPKVPRGEVSSLVPSPWFENKVVEYGVSLADFGRHPGEEVVILTCNMRSWAGMGERITRHERVDYTDTAETRRYREEVRGLNAFLASADIDFLEDGLEPRVDPFERTMRRHFVTRPGQPERFDQVGRLFGGFWLTLKSARRQRIRINGEPAADLDFSSMFTRLALARLRAPTPIGDVYAIEGAEGYRSGIKMAMNTFLFDRHLRRSKWPDEMGVGVGTDEDARDPTSPAADYEARLPAGWTVGRTRKAILNRHPAIKQAWGHGLGYGLMYDESRVLLTALNRLMAEAVPALGMHDGLLVQRSKKDSAKAIMQQAAREVVGMNIPVEEKG
jgi:hypothetical protein